MNLLWGAKDGGYESRVFAWGLEVKSLLSVLLLKFEEGSREAYHSHAFNAISWLLTGGLRENHSTGKVETHVPSVWPVGTFRETCHKVEGLGAATWVLSLRGPWAKTWREILPLREVLLTHGRQVL